MSLTTDQIKELTSAGCAVIIKPDGTTTVAPAEFIGSAKTAADRAKKYRERIKENRHEKRDAKPETVTKNVTNVTVVTAPPTAKKTARDSAKERTTTELDAANSVQLDLTASASLRVAFETWKQWRTKRAQFPLTGEKPAHWTQEAATQAAAKLVKYAELHGDEIAVRAVTASIAARYQGIFLDVADKDISKLTPSKTKATANLEPLPWEK